MKSAAIVIASSLALAIPANAGVITVSTEAGPIEVSPTFAPSIRGFIADVTARGFRGRVHCFSLSPRHVPGSLHKTGNACDFAQTGWGRTVRVMYHVRDLSDKWGLRNGCSFGDCGHIDSGQIVARRKGERRTRLAVTVADRHAPL